MSDEVGDAINDSFKEIDFKLNVESPLEFEISKRKVLRTDDIDVLSKKWSI